MNSVLVTHPGLQHSHQLALALHERKMLRSFWSGVPVAADDEPLPWWLPASYRHKVRRVNIPHSLRCHPARFQFALQALRLLDRGNALDNTHRVFHWFDAWAARHVRAARPKVVVAYENAALHTFKAAREIGARCVLDAAAFHHAAAARLLDAAGTPYTSEINRRKDEEVQLADLILTCSPLAAESYVANGVQREKLFPQVLGAELPANVPSWEPHEGPPRFVFAGSLSRLKSIDIIVAAFHRLHAEGLAYELDFVGGVSSPQILDAVRATPNARHIPSVPQKDLFPMLANADCLLLPSRYDSFGMVVAEAMACGTPAIVSTQTGAKIMIETFPGSGWIVKPELESLYSCLRELLLHPEHLRSARPLALQSGQAHSWGAYRARVGQLFEDLIQ